MATLVSLNFISTSARLETLSLAQVAPVYIWIRDMQTDEVKAAACVLKQPFSHIWEIPWISWFRLQGLYTACYSFRREGEKVCLHFMSVSGKDVVRGRGQCKQSPNWKRWTLYPAESRRDIMQDPLENPQFRASFSYMFLSVQLRRGGFRVLKAVKLGIVG